MSYHRRHFAITITVAVVAASVGWTLVYGDASAVSDPTASEIENQIESINRDMEAKRNDRAAIQRQTDRYRSLVMQKKRESASLADEVGYLDSSIASNTLDIEIAADGIRALDVETRALDSKITDEEVRLVRQRSMLGALVRRLYIAQFGHSPLEALLSDGTLAGYFDRLQANADLQAGVLKTAVKAKELKVSLEREMTLKSEKLALLEERKREQEAARMKLEEARALKESFLLETKSSEIEYRYALAELEREQGEADNEIRYLEKALREKEDLVERLGSGATVLSWPVDPSRGLTSLFHDPDYPFRNVFEHPAIDVRAYQGTAVRAAASGIVARAKNGGMGYSYVMILHSGGLSTVYGHISKFVAKEDAYVERGEIVGYSGGMPGTPGAGTLTTGPHLHFEVRENGLPVNPLSYLPAT
jgi:murein DD-endopeptidase MepM/ murein hydrolase activator NlpD